MRHVIAHLHLRGRAVLRREPRTQVGKAEAGRARRRHADPATGVGHFGSNYSASSAGRKWLLGGMGAAILSGLAWTITTTLYSATGG